MNNTEKILEWKDSLVSSYAIRNERYRNNWNAFCGNYDEIVNYDMRADLLAGVDRRPRKDTSWQVWNLQKPIVMTSVMNLARLPEVMVPAIVKGDPIYAAFADKQEKAYYSLWGMNDMPLKHAQMAFNLSCFGSTVTWVRPDTEKKMPAILVRRPETCYPMPRGEGSREFQFVIFRWLEKEDSITSQFPDLKGKVKPKPGRGRELEIVEYVDEDDYVVIVEDKQVKHVPHNYGFVPVTITPALDTGEIFGPSDIDQLVGINIYLNALMTKLADALEENLYPVTFIIGADHQPLNTGPGAFNFFEEGTEIKRLDPARIPPELFDMVGRTEEFMRTHAVWPRVMSGDYEGSIVTGKAITRLQGANTGMAALRQMYMAADLQRINSYMFRIMEKEWPKEIFDLRSSEPVNFLSPPGKQTDFAISFIPEEDIRGYYANQLLYSIFGADFSSSIVSGLQLKEGGLVSARFLRNQLPGLHDAEGMRLEIKEEKREEMEFEIELQQRLMDIQMQAQAQQAMTAAPPETGGAPEPGASPSAQAPGLPPQGAPPAQALPPQGGPPGAGGLSLLPGGQPLVMGVGEPLSGEENFPLPYAEAKPYGRAIDEILGVPGQRPGLAGGGGQQLTADGNAAPAGAITVEEVENAIEAIPNLKGQVYIIGRLAKQGWTDASIDLAITDKLDKQTIINALRQWYGKLRFTVVSVPPKQGAIPVEVNGGVPAQA